MINKTSPELIDSSDILILLDAMDDTQMTTVDKIPGDLLEQTSLVPGITPENVPPDTGAIEIAHRPAQCCAMSLFFPFLGCTYIHHPSNRIPQFVAYSDLPHTKGKLVACTQPRRVAAMSVAKRVADEMDGASFFCFCFVFLFLFQLLVHCLYLSKKYSSRSEERRVGKECA